MQNQCFFIFFSIIFICFLSARAQLDPSFANMSLRIAISVWPPLTFNCKNFPTLEPSKECPFPGFDAENLGIIMAHMGIKNHSFLIFDQRVTPSGAYVNGTWTNVMGMIMNGTVDTICAGYQRTEIRSRDFDFSYPVLETRPVFVVRKRVPGFAKAVMTVFRGFDGQVWTVIFIVFVAQIACLLSVNYVQLGDSAEQNLGIWAPGDMIFNMFRLFIMQCEDQLRHPTFTGKMLVVTFALADLLFASLYQGLLLTQLLHPGEMRPFQSADEMMQRIADKEYSLITDDTGHWYFQDLATSRGDHFVKMREALKTNPAVIIENRTQVLEMVSAGKYILPLDTDGDALYYAKHQYCDLAFIEDGLPSQYRHYLFKKNSPWLPLFNNASIGQQSFAINTWNKYFGPQATARDINEIQVSCPKEPPLVRALSIRTLTGLFCLLISGVTLSLVLFMLETMSGRRFLKRKRRLRFPKQTKFHAEEEAVQMQKLTNSSRCQDEDEDELYFDCDQDKNLSANVCAEEMETGVCVGNVGSTSSDFR